jgi:hypothetical protein
LHVFAAIGMVCLTSQCHACTCTTSTGCHTARLSRALTLLGMMCHGQGELWMQVLPLPPQAPVPSTADTSPEALLGGDLLAALE